MALKTVSVPARWQYFTRLRQGSPEVLCALDQHLPYGGVSLIARIHFSRNQGVEKDVTSLTIISSDHSWNFCPLLATLGSAGIEILVPEG